MTVAAAIIEAVLREGGHTMPATCAAAGLLQACGEQWQPLEHRVSVGDYPWASETDVTCQVTFDQDGPFGVRFENEPQSGATEAAAAAAAVATSGAAKNHEQQRGAAEMVADGGAAASIGPAAPSGEVNEAAGSQSETAEDLAGPDLAVEPGPEPELESAAGPAAGAEQAEQVELAVEAEPEPEAASVMAAVEPGMERGAAADDDGDTASEGGGGGGGGGGWLVVAELLPGFAAAATHTAGNRWFGARCMLVSIEGANMVEETAADTLSTLRRLEASTRRPVTLTFTRMHLEMEAYKQSQRCVTSHSKESRSLAAVQLSWIRVACLPQAGGPAGWAALQAAGGRGGHRRRAGRVVAGRASGGCPDQWGLAGGVRGAVPGG